MCRSVPQLALDAPRQSLVARAAATATVYSLGMPLSHLGGARLMTKEDNWPATLMTLQGHGGNVNAVAFHEGTNTIASVSDDNTLR